MLTIAIDLDAPTPLYRQIADELRALVARGALRDGDELPAVRDLARSCGVNLNTVAKAYRALADEGLVDLRHGARAHVSAPRPRAAATPDAALDRQLHDVIGRLVLGGARRRDVQRVLAEAVDRFFEARARIQEDRS